jgi:hypothetical protein
MPSEATRAALPRFQLEFHVSARQKEALKKERGGNANDGNTSSDADFAPPVPTDRRNVTSVYCGASEGLLRFSTQRAGADEALAGASQSMSSLPKQSRDEFLRRKRQLQLEASDTADQAAFEENSPRTAGTGSSRFASIAADSGDALPPNEWSIDFGPKDDQRAVLQLLLLRLREAVETRSHMISSGVVAEDGHREIHATRGLFVSSFVFENARVTPQAMRAFAACFRPHRCAVSLTFRSCEFVADAPRAGSPTNTAGDHAPSSIFDVLGDGFATAGVQLRELRVAHCRGLPFLGGLGRTLRAHVEAIEVLAWRGTFMSARGCDCIADLLCDTTLLRSLDVAHTALREDSVLALTRGLAASKTLEHFDIDSVKLAHGSGSELLGAVEACHTLRHISANFCDRASTRFRVLLEEAVALHRDRHVHL